MASTLGIQPHPLLACLLNVIQRCCDSSTIASVINADSVESLKKIQSADSLDIIGTDPAIGSGGDRLKLKDRQRGVVLLSAIIIKFITAVAKGHDISL